LKRHLTLDQYADGIRAGDTGVLARAITLIESQRADHQAMTQELITRLMPFTGGATRVGITGVPGVGKSTLIDALGIMLTGKGHRLAVLAVDPTSSRSGGSILGDKTRMARLAVDPGAFIRPSPSSGVLGGVGRMTRETILLCEAAGFDVVIVETVGTGQSETVVAGMVDFFLVLALPGAGDELQGIKKGIIELADMIAVTKADGDNKGRAMAARAEYISALHILEPASPFWSPPVVSVSAAENTGLRELWAEIEKHREIFEEAGGRAEKRRAQQVGWMWAMLEARILAAFKSDPAVKPLLRHLETDVAKGRITPVAAVEKLTAAFARQPN
jgi:LAO/AO transport system kinase